MHNRITTGSPVVIDTLVCEYVKFSLSLMSNKPPVCDHTAHELGHTHITVLKNNLSPINLQENQKVLTQPIFWEQPLNHTRSRQPCILERHFLRKDGRCFVYMSLLKFWLCANYSCSFNFPMGWIWHIWHELFNFIRHVLRIKQNVRAYFLRLLTL